MEPFTVETKEIYSSGGKNDRIRVTDGAVKRYFKMLPDRAKSHEDAIGRFVDEEVRPVESVPITYTYAENIKGDGYTAVVIQADLSAVESETEDLQGKTPETAESVLQRLVNTIEDIQRQQRTPEMSVAHNIRVFNLVEKAKGVL